MNEEKPVEQPTQPRQRGVLRSTPNKPVGHERYDWMECVDCRTKFPVIDGSPKCNGVLIAVCPWCCV